MEDIKSLIEGIRNGAKLGDKTSSGSLTNHIPINIPQPKQKFESFSDERPEMRYKTLDSGKKVSMYEEYIPGTDNNERLAQSQSGWEQTINGLGKAGANVGSVIAGNTVGFVYGLADWAKTGNFNSVFDNSFSQTLDDMNTKLNYQLPNYYTKDQKKAGFFGSVTSANFWANDVANGLSFTLGTIASEAIWAAATGGASIPARMGQWGAKIGQASRVFRTGEDIASVARVGEETMSAGKFGKALLGSEKVAEGLAGYKGFVYKALDNAVSTGKLSKTTANALSKTGEIINTTRFIGTSSGNEAGIEAFHFKKEATENFYRNFEELNGRPPTVDESAEMLNKIEGAANNVFAANMAILGVSNLAMLGNLFKIKSPISSLQKSINQKLFGIGVKEVAGETGELVFKGLERKAWQKGAGYLYKGVTPIIREGLFEEGLQGVTTKTANNWIERQYDPKYLNKVSSLSEDAWKAMGEQYGTKEGWKEIGIGGIVGLLGGVRVAGKGITHEMASFDEMAKEQKEVVAKGLNAANVTMKTFVSDINAGRMMTMAKVMEAEDRAEQAMTKKDVVSAKLAHNDSMIALAEMYNNPLYGAGGLEQMEKHGNNMIDTTEVTDQEKEELKAGFKEFIGEYKSANTFANSIVGNQGRIYGTSFQASDVQKALTYTILQGQTSKKIMDESLGSLQAYMNSDLIEAIKRNDDLGALGTEKKRQVKNLSQRYRNWEKKSEQVQKAVQMLQAAPNEVEGDKKSRLVEMQQKLIEIENTKTEIRTELEGIGREIAQNKKMQQSFGQDVSNIPITEDFIAVDDLINLDNKIDEIEKSYGLLKEVNPASAQAVKESMDNYKKAQQALLDHNSAIKLIASGKFQPQLADTNPFSGIYKKLSKGEEKAEEHTSQFLTRLNEIRESYKNSVMKGGQEKDIEKYQKELNELVEKDKLTEEEIARVVDLESKIEALKPKEQVTEAVKDDTPVRKESIKKELSPIEALKARIEDILKLFKSSFVGTYDVDEAVKNRPDQKDIERYRELLKSGEQTEEFEALKSKLSQWRVYDSLAEDEQSIADLLDLVLQLETEVEQENTVVEPNAEDTFEELKKTATVDILELSVNTNYPVTIKRETNGSYTITHMNPSSLLQRMGATDVKIGKKEFSFEEVDNQKKQGLIVDFISGGVAMKFTISDRGRISISEKDFKAIPNVKTIESLSSWTYPTLYEQDFEGNWKPISSDFSDPNITGDSNNLKEGDALELFIDVSNEYNQKLLKDKVKDEELENQVVIYIRKGGENYGTIKGLTQANRNELLGSEASIFTLRKLAAVALKEGKSGVVATTQVKYVQLGNPVLSINGNGRISQLSISNFGIKNIVATGFVQDGQITLNKKVDDVRKSFIKKISEKNKGKKVPIVIIKRGAQMIAFPVQMVKINVSKVEELNGILNNAEKTDAQKVTAINNLLLENGIAPKEFQLTALDEQKVNAIADRLDKNQEYKTAEQLADKKYKKENLVNDATIALDLENLNVSLPSQKFNVDLENLDYDALPEVKVESQEALEKEAEKKVETPKVVSAKKRVNKPKTAIKKEVVKEEPTKEIEAPKTKVEKAVEPNNSQISNPIDSESLAEKPTEAPELSQIKPQEVSPVADVNEIAQVVEEVLPVVQEKKQVKKEEVKKLPPTEKQSVLVENGLEIDSVNDNVEEVVEENNLTVINNIVEENLSEEEVEIISEDEGIAQEGVKEFVKKEVENAVNNGGKVSNRLSDRVKKIISRIVKYLMGGALALTLLYNAGGFRNSISRNVSEIFATNAVKDTVSFDKTTFTVTSFDGCNAYVSNQLKHTLGKSAEGVYKFDKLGFYGDAWTATANMVRAGKGDFVFNAFKDYSVKKGINKEQITNEVKQEILKNYPNLTVNSFKEGDIINLFYEGSNFTEEAYNKGKDVLTSHVGIIKKDTNGTLILEHNLHGIIKQDNLQDLIDKKLKSVKGDMLVSAIARPRFSDIGIVVGKSSTSKPIDLYTTQKNITCAK